MTNLFINRTKNKTTYYQSSLNAGSGKSHTTYIELAKTGKNGIIVIPRIDLIEEQAKLFNNKAILVHSSDNDPLAVTKKITNAICTIEASTDKHVLIITHAAFIQYNRWQEISNTWHLVIDESIEYYTDTFVNTSELSKTKEFWDMFTLNDVVNNIGELKFSSYGKKVFKEQTDDGLTTTSIAKLFLLSANNRLSTDAKLFNTEQGIFKVQSLLDFSILYNFSTVTFLSANFDTSRLYSYLQAFGIQFEVLDIEPYVDHKIADEDRVTIYQLTEDDISDYILKQLTQASFNELNEAINKVSTNKTIWTANKKYKRSFNVSGTYLTPKQSGTNEYKDMTTAVWLASMKTHNHNVSTASKIANLNSYDLAEMRELEPMYQFVYRTNLRVPNSTKAVTIIVFGPQQANYLKAKIGRKTDIKHLQIDLTNKDGNKIKSKTGGRKKSPLNKAERNKFKRYLDNINNGKTMKHAHKNKWFIEAAKTLGVYEDRFDSLVVKEG